MHDFIVKRAVDFVPDLLLHSLRAPAKNAHHFYSCFQASILPPNFLTGSLRVAKLRRCGWRPATVIMIALPTMFVKNARAKARQQPVSL